MFQQITKPCSSSGEGEEEVLPLTEQSSLNISYSSQMERNNCEPSRAIVTSQLKIESRMNSNNQQETTSKEPLNRSLSEYWINNDSKQQFSFNSKGLKESKPKSVASLK